MAGSAALGAGWRRGAPIGTHFAHAVAAPLRALEAQRGHLFTWTPVCLGTGIGTWFVLPVEPGRDLYAALGLAALVLLPFAVRGPAPLRPVFAAVILALAGMLLVGARAHSVAAPVLDYRYYGAVEGRVIEVDRSLSDKPRLTLDRVVLENMAPGKILERVRVSLHSNAEADIPATGATVILTAHLGAPQGPAEPGAFDFRRTAWFERLGAVGYTRTPVLVLEPPAPGLAGATILRLRRAIADGVRSRIPGDPGAFSAAILTGDRSGIGRATTDDLRSSSLAHLLSISGLHMALLTGFVFMAVRFSLALIPALALRISTKKVAAVVALGAAVFYLALSGGETPTERAFVMAAVMLVAVLLDRRALTLRAVAVAAVIVLVRQPEALTQPGFQMSFGATAALIVAFQAVQRAPDRKKRIPGWAAAVAALFFSSLVAGTATAPYAAAHFNRIADYSILANMLAVPIMGSVVMPAAAVAALLWPIGLDWAPLLVMEQGNRWILWVAGFVSDLPGAVTYVPAAPAAFLPVFTVGALFVMLWKGRARWAGLGPVVAAFVLWSAVERPAVLIADTGGIVGLMTAEGRVMSKPDGDGFAARSWLEDDGDAALQEVAAARAGFDGAPGALVAKLGGVEIVQVAGRGWQARMEAECTAARIVVVTAEVDRAPGPCTLLDARSLSRTGALAGRVGRDGVLRFESVTERAGRRLWTGYRPER